MADLITRQAAIDAVKKNTFRLTFAEEQNCEGHVAWRAEAVYSDVMEGALLELPSAQETHEERTETHACDLISRQDAIDAVESMLRRKFGIGGDLAEITLADLPSAQPEPQRTGRWINHVEDGCVECPFCHSATNCDDNISDLHFCFSCGARMEGE